MSLFREFVAAQGLPGLGAAATCFLFLVFLAVLAHALLGRDAAKRAEKLARLALDDAGDGEREGAHGGDGGTR